MHYSHEKHTQARPHLDGRWGPALPRGHWVSHGADFSHYGHPNNVLDVGSRFKNFDPNSLRTIELPVDEASIDGQSALQLHQPDAQKILDLFKGQAAGVGPSSVSVDVLNGTGRYNEATNVTTAG